MKLILTFFSFLQVKRIVDGLNEINEFTTKVPSLNYYFRVERGFRLFHSNEGLYNIEVEYLFFTDCFIDKLAHIDNVS